MNNDKNYTTIELFMGRGDWGDIPQAILDGKTTVEDEVSAYLSDGNLESMFEVWDGWSDFETKYGFGKSEVFATLCSNLQSDLDNLKNLQED